MENHKYGSVDYQGQRYTLTQQAYISDSGRYYEALATCDGGIYRVLWTNLSSDHITDIDGLCKTCRSHSCYYEDEGRCADWDCPSDVVRVD